jgi:hypothetical protein
MSREVIRFSEEPVLVKLDVADGIQVEGQYGVDWQYRVNDSTGVIYLPKEGRDVLKQSGAQAGDCVAIRKYKRGRMWVWDIERVSDAAEPVKAQNGSHRTPLPESKYVAPITQQLSGALCAAIDAVTEAQTYATNKGLHLQFSADDIRCIALSVYIGNQRNGGSR